MILVSSNCTDYSTNRVLDRAIFNNLEFLRCNKDDVYTINFDHEGIYICFERKKVKFNNLISSYWYRRGRITSGKVVDKLFNEVGNTQTHVLDEYLQYFLENSKHSIGNFHNSEPNKFIVLEIAKKCQLKVPGTFILEKREEVRKYLLLYGEIITKNHAGSSMLDFDDAFLLNYTSMISWHNINNIPQTFFPSLFQENISKKFELRVFFLKDHFYTMAIFSQNHQESKNDSRRATSLKQIRKIPFNLPQEVERKLLKLMNNLDLDTGSIDMIVSTDNIYYFLEVNPIGQFGDLSYFCNYHIESKIFQILNYES